MQILIELILRELFLSFWNIFQITFNIIKNINYETFAIEKKMTLIKKGDQCYKLKFVIWKGWKVFLWLEKAYNI